MKAAIATYIESQIGFLHGSTSGDFIDSNIDLIEPSDAGRYFQQKLDKAQAKKISCSSRSMP